MSNRFLAAPQVSETVLLLLFLTNAVVLCKRERGESYLEG